MMVNLMSLGEIRITEWLLEVTRGLSRCLVYQSGRWL